MKNRSKMKYSSLRNAMRLPTDYLEMCYRSQLTFIKINSKEITNNDIFVEPSGGG